MTAERIRSGTPPAGSAARRSAFALLVALGLLALLAVLATVYAAITASEASVAAGYVDCARARMCAFSGLESALARLRQDLLAGDLGSRDAAWLPADEPWDEVRHPSYEAGIAHGRAYSGLIGGTHIAAGDSFTLRVTDTNSQIDLDLPDPALASMLDFLGRAVQEDRARRGLLPIDPIAGRGARIVALRDTRGGDFPDKNLLRPLLGDRDYALVERYLTTFAWVDPNTIAPAPGILPEGMPAFVREPRPPINVNSAPWPVLVAALAEIEGPVGGPVPFAVACRVADEIVAHRRDRDPAGGARDRPARSDRGKKGVEAHALPKRDPGRKDGPAIVAKDGSPGRLQGSLQDASELAELLRNFSAQPGSPLGEEWAWTIRVNGDPNFHPAPLNLEAVVHAPFDRTQLRRSSTEFCFRSPGSFEISSLGRVLGPQGGERAVARVTAVMRVVELRRHTVQAEFERNRTTGPADHTATWPNGVGCKAMAPADWAGHVQLQADEPPPAFRGAEPRLRALFRDSLDGSGGPADTVTEQEAARDVSRGGDLFPDGALFSERRFELTGYRAPPECAAEGALEFWIKLDRNPLAAPVTVLLATFPATSEAGLQHRIRTRVVEGTLTVESTRVFYVAREYGTEAERRAFPIPYENEETTCLAVLPGAGQPHEWHHVAVRWWEGTRQQLYVDQNPGHQVSACVSNELAFAGWPPYRDLVVLGGADYGDVGREVVGATIDDLQIYDTRHGEPAAQLSRFPPASREYLGRFESGFEPLPEPAVVVDFDWTEWIPHTYAGRLLPVDAASLDMGIKTRGGGWTDVKRGRGRGRSGTGPSGGGGGGSGGGGRGSRGLGVMIANDDLRYEIRFHGPKDHGRLDVTPIVDDVTVYFLLERPRCLHFHWDALD